MVYDSRCILQIGFAAKSSVGNDEAVAVDAIKLMEGSLYQNAIKSGARKLFGWNSCYSLDFQVLHLVLNSARCPIRHMILETTYIT